ncbi:TCR/Tet family MFS transporter [Flaviaesturariibacter aridisoli]|uniref:MFS transporter n=1 Tax=Flaviaesturariibacter aridisoli TaxID=2545761 RepID=A0A4R4DZ25_9BACT|nr:TCR/Tet family MFS transporter [Flaviaesturariibacter aridisoli]TCZ67365.1 MFS transporter [Flaviaesturariibacter aridisoli]
MSPNPKSALRFIFLTLLIDITGLGLIIPVMPKLIESLTGGNISDAAVWGGALTVAYAAMQFACAPIIGNLSDQYGRRPVLLLSLLGFGVDYLFLSFAPSIGWLFVGRLIAGFTGASFTTASAYIADISTEETRAKNFGIVGAAFGMGFILGPVIGGLLGSFGPRTPFIVAAGLCLLNVLYGYFALPESLPADRRRAFSWRNANPTAPLLLFRRLPSVSGLVGALILVYIAGHAIQSNWNFYTTEKFGWTEKMIGLSLGMFGLLIGITQAGLIRIINPKIGNERSVYLGLALYALGMLLFAFASQTWMLFAIMVPYCLGGICGPALQAIISGGVPNNEQGALQGSLTSLMSATSIFGPAIMTNLFAYFTGPKTPVHFAGAPFLLGSLLLAISTVMAYRTLRAAPAARIE